MTAAQCEAAAKVSTARGKVKMDDVRHALRKPRYRKQAARVEELLVMDVEFRKMRDIGRDDFEKYANEDYGGGALRLGSLGEISWVWAGIVEEGDGTAAAANATTPAEGTKRKRPYNRKQPR
jgi:hypothetical protein